MATNNTRQKAPRYSTPKFRFRYPKLTTPDTKFKAEGEYVVELVADATDPQAVKLKTFIDKEAAKSLAEAKENAKNPAEAKKWETKYLPYKMLEDKETGEETGEIAFKFVLKASGVRKDGTPWEQRPEIFDAFGTNITSKAASLPLHGGAGIVSYVVKPYSQTIQSGASVKLELKAVQVIEVGNGSSGGGAEAYGFTKQDGFSAGEIEEDEETTEEEADTNGSTAEDF